jgi:desampylase
MILTRTQLEQLLTHAARSVAEVCGVLVGRRHPALMVDSVIAGANLHPTPRRHFLLDAATLLRADAAARASGRAIVGFYHSHPRSVAVPSQADRHESWPDHIMLIIGTTRGGLRYACAWIIDRDGALRPVTIKPESSSSAGH